MPKRICWRKGMRLTDDLLRKSDDHAFEVLQKVIKASVGGQFGLLPSDTPFELTLDISENILHITSLQCTGLTKDGHFIDIAVDSRYNNHLENTVYIPSDSGCHDYLLVIHADYSQWEETEENTEEPHYSFSLVENGGKVADNALPVGRIVEDYGWRMDDMDFVPPCLFIQAHDKYRQLYDKLLDTLVAINTKVLKMNRQNWKSAIRIFWPQFQLLRIAADKERDTMTPMKLLAYVQQCVMTFTCACDLDDYLNLADADIFRSYANSPYDYQNAYTKIREGLNICFSISEKIDKLDEKPTIGVTPDTPIIADKDLIQQCTNSTVRIPIQNVTSGAIVYYTTDGSEPTISSKNGLTITLDNGFDNTRKKEPDCIVTIKLKAFLNGQSSRVGTYVVTMIKDIKRWTGIQI